MWAGNVSKAGFQHFIENTKVARKMIKMMNIPCGVFFFMISFYILVPILFVIQLA